MTIRTDARASGRMDPSASVEPLSPATSAAVSAASAASPIATWHGIPQEPLEPIRPFVNSSEEKLYPASLKTSTEVSVHNTEPTKVPPPIAALTGTLGQRHVICVIGLPCSGQIPVAHTMRHYLEFMHGADVKCFDVNEFSAATPEANREELLSAVGAHLMSERRMSSAAASQIRPLVGTVLSDDRFHNVDPGKVAIVFDSDAAAHGDVPRSGTCERCETWSCSTKRSRRWVVQQLAELSTSTPISTTFVEVVIDDPAMLRAHLSLYDPQRAKAPAAPTEAELAALLAARRAYNRHYTAIQTMLQTNDDSEHDLSYVKIVNFETALAHRMRGFLRQRLLQILTVANPRPRTVYLSRHGFSEYNVLHKLGGNPRLSQWGEECAEAGSGTLACSAPVLSSRGAPTGTRRGSAHGRASTCCATRAGRERRRSYGRPRCSGRS
eukprot:Transcript_13012.p1 GENE.Transcript_13012~~Transcript_13012.p1  ORF type:complete len:450 (+),score=113.37 Transcript_13012:34-1350(+)